MKRTKLIALLTIAGLSIVSCNKDGKSKASLNTKLDSVSYALGVSSASQAKMMRDGLKKDFNLTLNTDAYLKGYTNTLDSAARMAKVEENKAFLTGFFEKRRALFQKNDSLKEQKVEIPVLPVSTDGSIKTTMDSISYAIGLNYSGQVRIIEQDLKSNLNFNLNTNLYKIGYKANLDSVNIKIDEKNSQEFLKNYFEEQQKLAGDKNKKIGEEFLAANKSKEGVKVTPSGLQYTVIKEGTGKTPTAESNVKVHYHGTLIDGTVFDSSVKRGQPAEFGVGQVIKGWTEGLQLMKEGAKYKFYIPQDLAYGARPAGRLIKPYSTLVFEVELLEVK